jgi:hypothetical protein
MFKSSFNEAICVLAWVKLRVGTASPSPFSRLFELASLFLVKERIKVG